MKKMLFAVVLSLAGVGLSTGQASAWLFCHHCCKSCATICVKPYNAFSPSAFGSICADGCCPLQFGHCCPPPPPPWMGPPPPWACCQPGCGPAMGCGMDGAGCGCLAGGDPHGAVFAGPSTGAPPQAAPAMLPPGAAPAFQAPPPAQLTPSPMTGAVGYPMGVQAAAYRAPAGYYPGYAPMPWMQPPPYSNYWNMPYPYGR